MDQDWKSTPLKLLQGLIWERGFAQGEIQSELFDDVHDSQHSAWDSVEPWTPMALRSSPAALFSRACVERHKSPYSQPQRLPGALSPPVYLPLHPMPGRYCC